MRFRILVLALALAAAGVGLHPSGVAAQGSFAVESLVVSLWPEYDRAEVLVLYEIHLGATTTLPTQVRVPIPASVTMGTDGSPSRRRVNDDGVRTAGRTSRMVPRTVR